MQEVEQLITCVIRCPTNVCLVCLIYITCLCYMPLAPELPPTVHILCSSTTALAPLPTTLGVATARGKSCSLTPLWPSPLTTLPLPFRYLVGFHGPPRFSEFPSWCASGPRWSGSSDSFDLPSSLSPLFPFSAAIIHAALSQSRHLAWSPSILSRRPSFDLYSNSSSTFARTLHF